MNVVQLCTSFSSSLRFRFRFLLSNFNFGGRSISVPLTSRKNISIVSKESNSCESSSPSAPFSRSPPLASNFNYTLPIGEWMRDMRRGRRGQAGEASKRGLERREWLDARPTYQDNGFHRSRCSVYTNPWQGVALDFHCIALSLTRVEKRTRALIHACTQRYTRSAVCSIAIFALLLQRLPPVPLGFQLARERTSEFSFSSFRRAFSPLYLLQSNFSFVSDTQTRNFVEISCCNIMARGDSF